MLLKLIVNIIVILVATSHCYEVVEKDEYGNCPDGFNKYLTRGFFSNGALVCISESSGYQNILADGNETMCWESNNGLLGSMSNDCIEKCTNKSQLCCGSEEYCDLYGCNPSADCFCRQSKFVNQQVAICNFGPVLVDNSTSWEACINLQATSKPSGDFVYYSEKDVIVTKSDKEISVKLMVDQNLPVVVLRRQRISLTEQPVYSESIVVPNSSNKRSLPIYVIPYSLADETIHIQSLNGSILIYQREMKPFWSVSKELCEAGSCNECLGLRYSACVLDNFGWLLLFIIFLSTILTLWLTIWIACCCRRCRSDGTVALCCCSYKIKRNKNDDSEMQLISDHNQSTVLNPTFILNTGTQSIAPQTSTTQSSSTIKNTNHPIAQPALYVMCIMILSLNFMPMSNAQCTTNVIANSNIQNCRRFNDTSTVCDFKPSFTVSIGGLGNIACIDLRVNSTKSVGTMEIKVTDFYAQQTLIKQYHTSKWAGIASSRYVCWGGPFTEACCDEKTYTSCADFLSKGGEINPCNYFSGDVLNLPGKTSCLPYPGGWNTLCFYYVDMCQYWRGAIKPYGNTIEVMSPGLITYTVCLKITLKTELNNTVTTICSTSPTAGNDLYSATLSGFFLDFGINWGSKKIGYSASNNNEARLIDAADANVPVVGSMGDIQANFPEQLTSPNTNSFQFANNIMSATAYDKGVTVTFRGSGSDMFPNFPSFPTSYTGFTWNFAPNLKKLTTQINRNVNSLVTINLKSNLQAFFVSDVICPEIIDLKAGGCFNCPYMAQLNVTAKSSCRPGVCTVSTKTAVLSNTTINLSTEPTLFQLSFLYGSADLSDEFSILCSDRQTSFNFTAKLVDFTSVFNRSDDTNVSPPAGGPSAPIGLDLINLKDSLSKFVLAVIIIVVVVLMIVLFYYIFRCCLRRKAGPVSNKETLSVLFGQKTTKEVGYGKLNNSFNDPDDDIKANK